MTTNMTNSQLYLPDPPESIRPSLQGAASPFPGLSALVTYYVARKQGERDQSIQTFCNSVATTLNDVCRRQREIEESLANKVDAEHFWSEAFFRQFAAAAEEFASTPDESKRSYLVDFVVYYSLTQRPDVTLVDIFWQLIRRLSGLHLVILSRLYNAQKSISDADIPTLRETPSRKEALSMEFLCKEVCSDRYLMEAILATLDANGLLAVTPGPRHGSDLSDRAILTSLGRRFMRFVHGEWG